MSKKHFIETTAGTVWRTHNELEIFSGCVCNGYLQFAPLRSNPIQVTVKGGIMFIGPDRKSSIDTPVKINPGEVSMMASTFCQSWSEECQRISMLKSPDEFRVHVCGTLTQLIDFENSTPMCMLINAASDIDGYDHLNECAIYTISKPHEVKSFNPHVKDVKFCGFSVDLLLSMNE